MARPIQSRELHQQLSRGSLLGRLTGAVSHFGPATPEARGTKQHSGAGHGHDSDAFHRSFLPFPK
jgi:hypothetical protein